MAEQTTAPAKVESKYYVPDDIIWKNPQLFTVLDGKRITLHGKDETVQLPADEKGPARTAIFKAATQAQLKKLHEMGHPHVHARD